MSTKSNTKRIIEIWMKACFEKLMEAQAENLDSESPLSGPSTKGGGDQRAETAK